MQKIPADYTVFFNGQELQDVESVDLEQNKAFIWINKQKYDSNRDSYKRPRVASSKCSSTMATLAVLVEITGRIELFNRTGERVLKLPGKPRKISLC